MPSRRIFAVIPAAGHSRRMGQSKLLLPLGGDSVIALILRTLCIPEIAETFVVVRKDDEPLRAAASREGATIIQPLQDPPDMRTSVTEVLDAIEHRWHPEPDDGWLLSPADHPALDQELIRSLAYHWQQSDHVILAPIQNGRRGHPTVFAWRLAAEIVTIPPDQGLNWLLKRHQVGELPVDCVGIFDDLDTPEDYARLQARWEKRQRRAVP